MNYILGKWIRIRNTKFSKSCRWKFYRMSPIAKTKNISCKSCFIVNIWRLASVLAGSLILPVHCSISLKMFFRSLHVRRIPIRHQTKYFISLSPIFSYFSMYIILYPPSVNFQTVGVDFKTILNWTVNIRRSARCTSGPLILPVRCSSFVKSPFRREMQ